MTTFDHSSVLLAVSEVARRLSISVRSVRTLIATGELPNVRVTSRRVAIAEADLAAYVQARRSTRFFGEAHRDR